MTDTIIEDTTYTVTFIAEARFTVEVEAESEEEAQQMVEAEQFVYEDLDQIVAVNQVEHVEAYEQ